MYTKLNQYFQLYCNEYSNPHYAIKAITAESKRFIDLENIIYVYGKNLNEDSKNIEFYLFDKNLNIFQIYRDLETKRVVITTHLFSNLTNTESISKEDNEFIEVNLSYNTNQRISFSPTVDTEFDCRIELEETLIEIYKAILGKISS